MSNKAVIREFVKSWAALDPEKTAAFFTEDGVYHNMPAVPVVTRAAIVEFIADFTRDWTATEWEVVSIVEDGDIVVAERIDHIDLGDKHIDLPCVGVFEMHDGKIRIWRDYFDLGTYLKALA